MPPKPTNLDAQRVLAIMDETKEKLTYLSVITPQVLEGLQSEEGESAVQMLGPEIMKRFAEQIRLEELYQAANTTSEGVFQLALDNEDVRETMEKLQRNTRDLCRRMRDIPNVVQELRNFQEQRPINAMKLIYTIAEMQEVMLKRLTTTVEEERSKQELLEHYIQREEAASRRKAQLEKELAHIRREREKAASSRSEIILKLKADLQDVQDTTKLKLRQHQERFDTREAEHRENYKRKEEELQKAIAELKQANLNLKKTSKEEEEGLRKRKKIAEKDVERLIADYDRDMTDKTTTLDNTHESLTEERKRLKELRDHFRKVDAENERIRQEEEIAKARDTMLGAQSQQKHDAASLIQAYFRGIKEREAYIKAKKSLKKGKKGKKKK